MKIKIDYEPQEENIRLVLGDNLHWYKTVPF